MIRPIAPGHRSRRRACRASIAFAVFCLAATGSAQDLALPAPRAQLLSADPNAPITFMQWRGSIRGQVSLNVPVIGEPFEDRFSLNLQPLFEIHNEPEDDSPTRSPHWRGRLSLYGAWTWLHAFVVQLGVEHESDHYTARSDKGDEFLALNDVYLAGSRVWATDEWSLALRASAQVYVWSCNVIDTPCRDFQGSTTVGGNLGLVWDLRGQDPSGFAPFVALDFSGILGNGAVDTERRAIVRVGGWALGARDGLWQLFALGFLGNDLGISRATRRTQWGLGVAYAP